MSEIQTPLDLFRVLFEPFPDDVKETQSMGGKGRITYVEWHHYIARAWKEFPEGFSKEIVKVVGIGSVRPNPAYAFDQEHSPEIDDRQVIITVRITDKATGLYQESTGSADASKKSSNYGGCSVEAEHQATKRAFAHFGLGLEMYMDSEDLEQAHPDAGPPQPKTEPEPEQIQRMKQLVTACSGGSNTLLDIIQSERHAVRTVNDKKWRIGLAIEVLEDAMKKEGLEVPDPS
jgi:hypothetical protein